MGVFRPDKPKQPLSSLTGQAFDQYMASEPDVEMPADLLDESPESSNAGPGRSVPANAGPDSPAVSTDKDALKEITKRAKAANRRLQSAARKAVEAVIDLGESLSDAKFLMSATKQSYTKWLASTGIPRTTANRATQVWERLGHPTLGRDDVDLSTLELSTCYLLASPSTPQTAVDEVLMLTTDGDVTPKQVKAIVAQHRPIKDGYSFAPVILETETGTVALRLKEGADPVTVLQDAIETYLASQRDAA
jgi:hypothetical protein